MTADSAETRHPHLDLDDLIAGAAGQPVGERARDHLARCEDCQREADRWKVVADGVHGLAAAAPEPDQPAWPPRTRQSAPTLWTHAIRMAVRAVAAVVLLAGVGVATGTVKVHLPGRSRETILASVRGCSQLEQADGTLEQVNGSRLVIQTSTGQPVTLTTTASTFMSISGAPLSYITDGASVMVRGYSDDTTIEAAIVTVGQPYSAVSPTGFVSLQGTVSDAGATGFNLVTSGGARVPVTTTVGTLVVVPHASPNQLQPGTSIFAIGNAGEDGTLSARAVAAVSQLPHGRHTVSVKDSATSSIIEAVGTISAAPPDAG